MATKYNSKIFIQIASYRDPQLLTTIRNCIKTAKYPKKLVFCIAWQHDINDEWDNLDEYKNDKRFKILDIDYKKSKGACWARNQIQQYYNQEQYTLQLDSHHEFVKNWDEQLIEMYDLLISKGHAKPLITTYLPSYFPGEDTPNTQAVWKMGFDRFTPQGYIFTRPSTIDNWESLTEPVPARFYSAHFAFTTGKFCVEVQHDPKMYFHGEEPSIAVRAYTHGYDLFHPHKIIAWHQYTRTGMIKHWDDFKKWGDLDRQSHERYRILHLMDGCINQPGTAKYIEDKYNFGKVRTLQDYEIYAGVKFNGRRVQQYTLDAKYPPNLSNDTVESFNSLLLDKFKHCIDIHRSHFKHDDYDSWVVAFEMNDGTVCKRLDIDATEIKKLLNIEANDFVKIWKEYDGVYPEKWVVWPHSKSKGWVERIETKLI